MLIMDNDQILEYLQEQAQLVNALSTPEGLLANKDKLDIDSLMLNYSKNDGPINKIKYQILDKLKKNETYSLDELLELKAKNGVTTGMFDEYLNYTYTFIGNNPRKQIKELCKYILEDLGLAEDYTATPSPFDGVRNSGGEVAWIALHPKDRDFRDSWQFFIEISSDSLECGKHSGRNLFEDYVKECQPVNSYEEILNVLNEKKNEILQLNKDLDIQNQQANNIETLRTKLIEYFKDANVEVDDTPKKYTALKIVKNIAEIHRVGKRSDKFRIVINFEELDEVYQTNVKRVPDSYKWTNLNGEFWIDSESTCKEAQDKINNILEKNSFYINKEKLKEFITKFAQLIFDEQSSNDFGFHDFDTMKTVVGFTGVPYFSLIGYQQDVRNGIYPLILVDKNSLGMNFEVCYGVSMRTPQKMWGKESVQALNTSKTTYSKCLVKQVFNINNLNDFNNSADAIVDVLSNIIFDYKKIFEDEISNISEKEGSKMKNQNNVPLNQILYGPPGTGKTYHTKEILENLLKSQVAELNQHNSSNEDLKIKEAVENLTWYGALSIALYRGGKEKYKVKDIKSLPEIIEYFKVKNCKDLDTAIWAHLQIHTNLESPTVNYKNRLEPFLFEKDKESYWYLTKDGRKYVEEEMSDVLDKFKTSKSYAIEDFYKFITFHQSYAYEEFIEGIKPDLSDSSKELSYILDDGIFKKLCVEAKDHPDFKYAIVIDEINRGNISKIFGELITLIEENKRIGEGQAEALEVTLPYSKEKFGVPKNLYIIGTMNTSDRSIASVDIALRRRFRFKEMMPKYECIPEEHKDIKLRALIKNINDKISVLLDRDHQIGHSYFMQDKLDRDGLENVWFGEVMPLFNEYFFGEWDKLIAVLGLSTTKSPDGGFVKQLECPKGLGTEWLDENCYDFIRQGEDGFEFLNSLKKLEPTVKEGQTVDG